MKDSLNIPLKKGCTSITEHNGHVVGCEKGSGHKGYHKSGFHAW